MTLCPNCGNEAKWLGNFTDGVNHRCNNCHIDFGLNQRNTPDKISHETIHLRDWTVEDLNLLHKFLDIINKNWTASG